MKVIKEIALFAFSFMISLFVLDIFISITEIQSKSPNIIDNVIGRSRNPGVKYASFTEGFGMGQFNEYGYLGPSYPPEKSDTTYRIALVGDSYVEGFSVFDRHHFRSILEDSLSKHLNRNVEILNFGHSGYRLGNMYVYNELFVNRFNPDLTLFFLFELSVFGKEEDFFPELKIVNDSLIIDNSVLDAKLHKMSMNNFLVSNSTIVVMLKNAKNLIKNRSYAFSMFFDKFYTNTFVKTDDGIEKQTHQTLEDQIIIDKMLKNLQNRNVIIVNRNATAKPFIEGKYNLEEIFIQPYIEKAFNEPRDAHYYPVANKFGHWNQKAHQVVAEALLIELIDKIEISDENK